MRTFRRSPTSLALLATLTLFAGCGSDETETSARTDRSAQPRVVEHEFGSTRVPAEPQRIVTIDSGEVMAHLLALGEEAPLAAGSYFPRSDDPWPALSAQQTEGVETFDRNEPPLERIAALRPDLIIGSAFYMEEIYDQLSQIAPTVGVNQFGEGGGLRTALTQVGQALGKEGRAEQVLTEFDGMVARTQQEIDNAVETVSVISVRPDSVRVWTDGLVEAQLVEALGFELTPTAETFEGQSVESDIDRIDISPELVSEIDGEAMIVRQLPEQEDEQALEELRDGALWRSLPAVEEDRVLVTGTLDFTGGVFGFRQAVREYAEFLDGSASG